MNLADIRRLLRRHPAAWLLALVLWLPAAQWAASAHAVMHLHALATQEREPPAQLPTFCDTCVVAAAVGAGAPLPELPVLVPVPIPQFPPTVRVRPWLPTAAAPAYRSRAPPALHA